MKTCSVCNTVKPLDDFGFVRSQNRHLARCRVCEAARIKEWKHKNIERVRAQSRGYAKARYKENREHLIAVSAKWRAENPEKFKEMKRRYRSENLERSREKSLEWRNNNLERARKNSRKWFSENKQIARAYTAGRRAAKASAVTTWDKDLDNLAIVEAYDKVKRLQALTGAEWHVDHVVPLQGKIVCGLHNAYNIRVLPAIDNLKKGNRYWPGMP